MSAPGPHDTPSPAHRAPRIWLRSGVSRRLTAAGLGLSLAVALAFVAAGCGPSKAEERAAAAEAAKRTAETVARLAPGVKRKVAQVDKLRGMLSAVPPAPEDAKAPAPTPPMKLKEVHYKDADANADVMLQNDLALLQRGIIGSCNYHVRAGGEGLSVSSAEEILGGCAKVRYFLVVRPSAKVKAEVKDSDTYEGGEISGDVVVFELPDEGDPKSLGAFPIDVVLTGSVKVKVDATRDRVEYELNEALRKQLLAAIEKKLGG